MKRIQALLAICVVALGFATSANAQRTIGARQLILDNGAGQSITLQTPAGGWSGNIPFLIPIPPAGNPSSGFTYAGTAANQILTWVIPNATGPAPNNYAGGVQGSWQPTTLATLNVTTGTGAAGTIPVWTGSTTQGNSALTDNGTTLTYAGLGGFNVGGTTNMLAATVGSGLNITGGNLLMGGTTVLNQTRDLSNINNISMAGTLATPSSITAAGAVSGGSLSTAGAVTGGSLTTAGTAQGSIVNATTGFRANNVAPAGLYLRGNGANFVASGIQVADVPTLNQSTTGTAANVTGVVAIANGGTGQTSQQAAINALTGAQTNGLYLRSNGTNATLSALNGADITTATVPVGAINASGTANNTTFLRGDGTWNTPTAAGPGVAVSWGVYNAATNSYLSSHNVGAPSIGGGPFYIIPIGTGAGTFTQYTVVVTWYGGVGSNMYAVQGNLAGWSDGTYIYFADYVPPGSQVTPASFVSFVLYAK